MWCATVIIIILVQSNNNISIQTTEEHLHISPDVPVLHENISTIGCYTKNSHLTGGWIQKDFPSTRGIRKVDL